MPINHLSPPSDEGAGVLWTPLQSRSTDRGGSRDGDTVYRDGGREIALIKLFLTTPQSPTVTAPLTRGAKIGFFRRARSLFAEFHICKYFFHA